jgi:hypothetical protein
LQDKVEKYAADVIAVYADSFVKEAIYGAATRITANDRLVKVRGLAQYCLLHIQGLPCDGLTCMEATASMRVCMQCIVVGSCSLHVIHPPFTSLLYFAGS